MLVRDPAQLARQVGQFARRRHHRMAAEDAFEQGGAGARQADDEDRHRPGMPHAVVRGQVRVESGDDLVEQARFGGGIVGKASVHHRIAAHECRPGVVELAEVVELLVQRELERGVVFGARCHRRQPRADEVDMVACRRLPADACKGQRGATERGAQAQAGFQFRFGVCQAAIELQLQRAEIAEVGCVEAGVARAVHQRQRLRMQSQSLLDVRERRQCGARARARDFRMLQARARGIGFAQARQRLRHLADQVRIAGQRGCGEFHLLRGGAHAALGQHDAGQQQPRIHLGRVVVEQGRKRRLGRIQASGEDMVLAFQP